MLRGSQWGDSPLFWHDDHGWSSIFSNLERSFRFPRQNWLLPFPSPSWPRLWMTSNYIFLVRSHRDLVISNINLWLHSFWFDDLFRQIWSHVWPDMWPISKIRPERNFILVPTFRITSYFHSMIYILGRNRCQSWPDFKVWEARDLELEFEWPWNLNRWVSSSSIQIKYDLMTPFCLIVTAFLAIFKVTIFDYLKNWPDSPWHEVAVPGEEHR